MRTLICSIRDNAPPHSFLELLSPSSTIVSANDIFKPLLHHHQSSERPNYSQILALWHRGSICRTRSAAMMRKVRQPCAVICSLVKPMRRRAAVTLFSEIGRARVRTDGNLYFPLPVRPRMLSRIAIACRDSGTAWPFRTVLIFRDYRQTKAIADNQ